VELKPLEEQTPMTSIDNFMLPSTAKSIIKETSGQTLVQEEVEVEEKEEEALWEHLSQLVNHKHKLLF
jgi:hypothetical protein